MLSELWVSMCPHTFCFKEQQSFCRQSALKTSLSQNPPAAKAPVRKTQRQLQPTTKASSAVKFMQTSTKLMNNYLAPAVDRFHAFFFFKRQSEWRLIIIIITSAARRGLHLTLQGCHWRATAHANAKNNAPPTARRTFLRLPSFFCKFLLRLKADRRLICFGC